MDVFTVGNAQSKLTEWKSDAANRANFGLSITPSHPTVERLVGGAVFALMGRIGVPACLKALLMLVLMLAAGEALAFDPPRIIGHLTASEPSLNDFATDFVCVGDQNGDGFDDLLVNHGTWDPGEGDKPFSNRIELYYGGQQMDDQPDFVIAGPPTGPIEFGERINYLGHLTGSENPFWAVQTHEETEHYLVWNDRVLIYEAGNRLDNRPEFTLSAIEGNGIRIPIGRRMASIDLNGDGYNDLLTGRYQTDLRTPTPCVLEAYFGSEEFDTIPDWCSTLEAEALISFDISGGYDVNSDHYDDYLLRELVVINDEGKLKYSLFLGGDPMDTVAVWEFYEDRFEDILMNQGFAMVPDVNGDGYDDWVIHFWRWLNQGNQSEGYYLFFGGRDPDPDPDARLAGAPSPWGVYSEVVGGDVNGDGVGDIIGTNQDGFVGNGSIQVFFGSRWFSDRAAVTVNFRSEYGALANGLGEFVGAVGDYNGDEINDFIVTHDGGRPHSGDAQAYIFSGDRNWEVSVKPVITPSNYELSLSASPNPFNDNITIQYSINAALEHRIEVYDVKGRSVAVLVDGLSESGNHSISWSSRASGIYFVALTANTGDRKLINQIIKVVCLR